MRIFPEGLRDAMEPSGKALMIIAGFLLAIAVGAFCFKTWIFVSWPRTNGIIVESRLVTEKSDNGTVLCSAVYTVEYEVNGTPITAEQGGHSYTSDCAAVRAEVESARGKSKTVIYNRQAPSMSYTNGGFNLEFYLVSFVLSCLTVAFSFGGWVAIKIGRWMQRESTIFLNIKRAGSACSRDETRRARAPGTPSNPIRQLLS